MLKFDGGNFNLVSNKLMMRVQDFCGIFQDWPNKCGISSRLSCIIYLLKFKIHKLMLSCINSICNVITLFS